MFFSNFLGMYDILPYYFTLKIATTTTTTTTTPQTTTEMTTTTYWEPEMCKSDYGVEKLPVKWMGKTGTVS